MIWFLAVHSLRQRPLRTALTALGIAVAVGSTVIFLSLGEGLRQVFRDQLGNIGPDLQVSYGPFDSSLFSGIPELPLSYMDELQADAERYGITNIVPLLLYARGGFSLSSAYIFEGMPAGEDISQVYHGYDIVKGRGLHAGDRGAFVAVVGQEAAERGGLEVGDTLRLNPDAEFDIVGIATSQGGLAENAILVPLEALQEAIDITDRVNLLAIDLAQPATADEVAEALAGRYPDLDFQTRADVLSVLEQGIRISDVVRLGISVIALIVGGIAVANTVLMSVFERTREFGVVRALGAKPRFLFGLVLAESVLLSLIGAAAGLVLGRLGILAVNNVADNLIGLEVAALTPRLVLFAVAVATLTGLVSGLLPAARAARIPIAAAMARE